MKNKRSISAPLKGMSRDISSSMLQNNQYTFASNINSGNESGDEFVLNLEPSNYYGVKFPESYVVVGFKVDLLKSRTYYFLTSVTQDTNSLNFKRSSIGYVDNNDIYNINYNNQEQTNLNTDCNECGIEAFNPLVQKLEEVTQVPSLTYVELINDKCLAVNEGLNFDINFPAKKIEINQEKLGTTIYWNDYRNPPRYLNLTNLEEKGAQNYLFEINDPCEDISYGTCIDVDKLLIFPKHNRIILTPTEQQIGGNLKKGTYEFWGAYCDLMGNEMTQYSSPTNPITIFDENNNILSQTETDEFTNFAIKIKVDNLDTKHFKYYKIAVVERNNVVNTQSIFLAGIYPTTDDTVIYTHSGSSNDDIYIARGNVSLKKRMDFNTLNAIKPNWEKAKFTMVSGDVLWHGGLIQEEELNIQPVMNLFGALMHWQTSASSENLYKNAIANSRYKGFTRNEVQPLGIRLIYTNGGYSATMPLISRPKRLGEDDILTGDTNLNSVINNSSSCITSDRNKKWQIYNTALAFPEQCSNLEEGSTEIEEPATNFCTVDSVYTITSNSVTIIPEEQYYDLETYVNDNPDDPAIAIITNAVNGVYPGNCQPAFIGDCDLPASLDSETNVISEIVNEVTEQIPKETEDYLKSVPPSFCSPYKRNLDGTGYQEDTDFMNSYMGCNGSERAKVFIRDANFNNETCGYAETLPNQTDPSQSGNGIFLNYAGASTEADLLQVGYDVFAGTIDSEFKNKLHKKAQFFKVSKGGRNKIVLEITKSSQCPNSEDRDNLPTVSRLRYTIYSKCGADRVVLGGNIVNLSDGFLEVIDVSTFPNDFYVAIDAPMLNQLIPPNCSGAPSIVPIYKIIPPCGCFSMYARDEEFSSVRVSWDSIILDKVQQYSTQCRYRIPKVNDCNPIPYKKGIFSYWESTETYDDNKQLWDSSEIRINGSDLNLLSANDRQEFLDYYTNGLDQNGTYILKGADFRCQPIRHPKMPDNTVAPFMIDSLSYRQDADSIIFPLGVELDSNVIKTAINIAYSNGLITKKQRDNIKGYEILRGDNSISKSVIANGVAFDFYNYQKEGETINFSNFPFNDLGKNKYLLAQKNGQLVDHPYNSEKNHMYSFLSPDVFLTRPSLPTEVSLQGFVFGNSMSSFSQVDEHSRWTVLGDKSRRTAEQLAIAEATMEVLIKTGELIALQQGGFVFSLGAVGAGIAAAAMLVAAYTRIGKYRYDWLTIFRDLGRVDNFANMQTGVAKYNKFLKAEQYSNEYLRKLAIKKHLKEGDYAFTDENTGEIVKVNNWLREQSVFLSTGKDYPFDYSDYTSYTNYDNNKKSSLGSNFTASEVNCKLGVESTRNVASPYFSLKNYIPDQWGKIDSIKWLTTNYIFDLDENTICKPIFGGTSVISRFSWRKKAPIFRSNAVKLADKLPFMYSEYENIAYPRFYTDYEVGDVWTNTGIPFPDIKSHTYFDCETGRRDFYYKPPSKFYLFVHGVVDFLVESEINCNYRYAKNEPKEWFYPQHQNLSTWLQEVNVPMIEPNTFHYNNAYSLGVSNSPYKFFDKTYDKEIWRKRNLQQNAVTYSEKEVNENDLTNPWLVYKPLNWKEFKTNNGRLIDMHNIESDQFLVRFENRTILLNSIDNLAERLTPQNIQTGVGGMFYQRLIETRSSDLGFNGTQHTDIVSTPYGHFSIDALRGKILKIDQNGQVSDIISEQTGNQPTGMREWFREHVPMKILKQFPTMDTDNKYKGIGYNMWYDDREARVFITKRDYIAKNTECLEYDKETGIFYSCGDDTVSCPEGYTYNSLTELCEKQVISAPICPPNYIYDELTKTCTLTTIETADCSCTVDVIATPGSQNIITGETTSIALTSTTLGATFTWTVASSGVSGAMAGSGNTISQTLTNTGVTTGTVIYTITPTFENCTPTPIDVIVTVQASPTTEFKMFPVNMTTITGLQIAFSSGTMSVNWGDGLVQNYNVPNTISLSHTYSTPFTGEIIVTLSSLSYLTSITGGSGTGTYVEFKTSEITKLTSLNRLNLTSNKNYLSGIITEIPSTMKNIMATLSNLSGDISDMPISSERFNIYGTNTLTGNISTIIASTTNFAVGGNNTITGNLNTLKPTLDTFSVSGLNTVTGNIFDSPLIMTSLIVTGNSTISEYTAGKVWQSGMVEVQSVPVSGGLTTTEVDNLLIDLSNATWVSIPNVIRLTGNNAPRSSASDSAVITLQGSFDNTIPPTGKKVRVYTN